MNARTVKAPSAYRRTKKELLIDDLIDVTDRLKNLEDAYSVTEEDLNDMTEQKDQIAAHNCELSEHLKDRENRTGQLEKTVAEMEYEVKKAEEKTRQAERNADSLREDNLKQRASIIVYKEMIDKLLKVAIEDTTEEVFNLIKSLQSVK